MSMRKTVPLLAVLTLAVLAIAQPKLTVTSGAVVEVEELTVGGNWTYTLVVELPPLARLLGEKLACLHGAEIRDAATERGAVSLQDGCITLTAENPTVKTVRIKVRVDAIEPQLQPQPEQPPILLAAAAAVTAATAAYLALSESGRGKLFSAISIPVAYYVTKRSDVARSPKRVKILEYIKANPGASMRRIARETGISYGEVQWHLSVLERLGLVECVKVGKYTCYYPTGTPTEVWLTNFAEKELKLNPAALEKARQAAKRGTLNPKGLTELLDL